MKFKCMHRFELKYGNTSGSGIFTAIDGTSLLNTIGNLFGNTIIAPICSTIIRRSMSLKPGISNKSATPT